MTPPPWDAVFLDRDGTLTAPARDRYVVDPSELRLLASAGSAVRRLNCAGIPAFVVTNQQGVASGQPTQETLTRIHDRLTDLLAAEGARLDGIYVCPHRAGTCTCRKPSDGLLREALREHPRIVAERCAIVGDSLTDTDAGAALNLFRILVVDDSRPQPLGTPERVDLVVADVGQAVTELLARRAGR